MIIQDFLFGKCSFKYKEDFQGAGGAAECGDPAAEAGGLLCHCRHVSQRAVPQVTTALITERDSPTQCWGAGGALFG